MTILQIEEITDSGVRLVPETGGKWGWSRLRQKPNIDLSKVQQEDRALAYALARVRALDPVREQSVFRPGSLTLSHTLIAKIEEQFAPALGLPQFESELVFAASFDGSLGSPDAHLGWSWERRGRREIVPRTGALLFPADAQARRRVPAALLEAIDLIQCFDPKAPLADHWRALASFRQTLGDATRNVEPDQFLKNLKIISVARIGLEISDDDPAAFSAVPIDAADDIEGDAKPVLKGAALDSFQAAVSKRGALPAYRLADGTFAIIDKSASPVLEVIAEAMKGDTEERTRFIDDAPRLIEDALERHFRLSGEMTEETTPEDAAEMVALAVSEGWAETESWSNRVIGIGIAPTLGMELGPGSGLPWLPDAMEVSIGELLGAIPDEDVDSALAQLKTALLKGQKSVRLSVGDIPVQPEVLDALERRLALMPSDTVSATKGKDAILPLVHDNLFDLDFVADYAARECGDFDLPDSVKTALFDYQRESFHWQVDAWSKGMPGILNADEQGLGKTLQTLSFLAWVTEQMRTGKAKPEPILIVAPTSLLQNWQDEYALHLAPNALGPVHRLYSTALAKWKTSRGRDIGDGKDHLDLSELANRQSVVITTYQTLANYAVSFQQLRFSAAVFDEMQFVKNPRTQRAIAAKGVQANFKIALTGTPLENRAQDLWAIVDSIAPGPLGAMSGFNRLFEKPGSERLERLRKALFSAPNHAAPLCQRRTKKEADPSIPGKVRLLHARPMPRVQEMRYDEARAKTGGILQVLQHIRRVSAHPGLVENELTNDFIGASARTEMTMDILRHIESRDERALIFVENRDLQSWMAELIKVEFDLAEVMVINGNTPIDDRRAIRQRFQRNREGERGFDVLLLGPRAAGTGLTLTAANHVIHLTRWWNPAVEEQCNDRTHRIGQTKDVRIHIPIAIHPKLGPASFDCLLHKLITRKRQIAEDVLAATSVTKNDLKKLYAAVVSGEVTEEGPFEQLKDSLPGRQDLIADMLTEDIMKVSSREWSGDVIVSSGKNRAALEGYLSEQTMSVIVVGEEAEDLQGQVPLSRLTIPSLWPEFGLPH